MFRASRRLRRSRRFGMRAPASRIPLCGTETPSRTCGTRGAERARRRVRSLRDADVRIPGLFGLPAFAPASADGTVRSDGGDAPEATDKPREHARPRSASANVRRDFRDYRDYPSD